MAKDLYIEFPGIDGGSLNLTLLSHGEHLRAHEAGKKRAQRRASMRGTEFVEEPITTRTALLTVRGKDNDITAAEMERLGKACLKYAAEIREKG